MCDSHAREGLATPLAETYTPDLIIIFFNDNRPILTTCNSILQCLGGTATDVMYRELYDKSSIKTIIMGGGCSVATIPTAEASKLWNLIQVTIMNNNDDTYERVFFGK